MTDPRDEDAEQARRALASIAPIGEQVTTETRRIVTGRALAVWGVAWLLGYLGTELFSVLWAMVVWLVVMTVAIALTWRRSDTQVRAAHESVLRRCWAAWFLGTPLVLAVAGPQTLPAAMVLLGALWGLGFLLFGVVTRDVGVTVLAALVLVAAPLATWSPMPAAVFGVACAVGMIGLGTVRQLRRARPGQEQPA